MLVNLAITLLIFDSYLLTLIILLFTVMTKKSKKNLVIVESPAKAKTLKKFLGSSYEIAACMGHIRDLPPKSLGVNIEKGFDPNYKIIKGKEKIVKSLQRQAKTADTVFLAPDPDREGEAIAWHLKTLLGNADKIKRIEFHEITKSAVQKAVEHPREIDLDRVDAQQARRILDRLVGYKISPLLWKKIRKGLSAGRVQSVAVRLICKREAEIKKFQTEEYWFILAKLASQAQLEFSAKLIAKGEKSLGVRPKEKGEVIKNQAEAEQIVKDLQNAIFVISQINRKEQKRYPTPPFITSTLQQEAARKLGYSTKKTMVVAQKLYEGINIKGEGHTGLITYMRTDSVRIAEEAEEGVRKFIIDTYGQDHLPDQPIRYKKKKQAQDAHEAIRPTSAVRHPDQIAASLKPDELKLYELIWKRFVACQMNPAIYDQTSVDIKANDYLFRATGSILKYDGFMRIYLESKDEEEEEEEEKELPEGTLPELKDNEPLTFKEIIPEQHFTQPPARFNEASLVKELEKRGIGRPSTYAPIMSTIQNRGYVEKVGRALKPTEIGMITNEMLVKHFPKILDFEFTAHMEDSLDDIVEHKMNWTKTLEEFYEPFAKALAEASVKMATVKKEIKLDEKCPECGKPLMIRSGRYGDFIACSAFPDCKLTKPLEQNPPEFANEKCNKCGSPMILKQSRFGTFLACSAYPKCKNIKSILKKIEAQCPKCGQELVERRTRKGKVFYGCIKYPKCDYATWQRPATPAPKPDAPKKEDESV
ncbi:type I DNA topoisomerase [Candidatus Saganbacteria bacterium CG08_land_8_20_14_0_20_45_16]|uniref:DNA topoisomerase 1 n=1 Tax=Candidatus Saganbacteria bacterium CG08_land_8_20_14_0_20_45_16 TaxID=2014293 RepID=A0A2H0Y264_UNCSA|nr:MAG: type I DNA topoisomerase [Candidatus Saganbacteria bacterium CG08_land_8_20_14_0_20_45_16]